MKKFSTGTAVYAIVLDWPDDNILTLGAPVASSSTKVTMLGLPAQTLTWKAQKSGGITITIPTIPFNKMPCEWVWIFKLEGITN